MEAVVKNSGVLPKGWKVAQLGDVLSDIIGGGTPSRNVERYWNGDIPWITVKDMRSRRPELIQEHITRAGVDECATNIIPADTVITATRVGLGKVVRVPYPAAINQDLKALIVGPKLDKSYLEWWIIGNADFIDSIGSGTTVKGIRLNQLRELEIPLAPLPEQRRIVEAIELQLGRLDAAVAHLHAAKAKLKRYKQAVLKAAFEIDCERLSTNDVTELITDGDHQAPPQVAEGVPFIVISNVKNNEVDFSVTKYVPEAYYNALSVKRKPRVGDVLYTVTGSYGIPVLVSDERPFCFQRHIALLRPNAKVLAAYLYLWLQTPDAMTQAKDVATGTAQMTVPLKGLRAFELPVPRLSEQKAIVRDVASRLERMTETNATLDAQLLQSTRLRQAVLKRAFEGRLV